MHNFSNNKLFVVDYDGTLADNKSKVSDITIKELIRVGERGIIRVVATGRSFFSFEKAAGHDFPIDYLICSSGIGIYDWNKKKLLSQNEINNNLTNEVYNYLITNGYDFMVQLPVPNNHFFHHYHSGKSLNNDFFQRIENYKSYGLELIDTCPNTASQFVIIFPEENGEHEIIAEKFKNLSVIKATSPIDGKSIWVEILPYGITKASGIEFLQKKLRVDIKNIVSVGNDYYDLKMLNYTFPQNSYIVANAPDDLKRIYNNIASNEENGVADLLKILY